MLQTRLAQFRFPSQYDKVADRVALALMQRLAGDTAGATATADQARKIFEQLYKQTGFSTTLPPAPKETSEERF